MDNSVALYKSSIPSYRKSLLYTSNKNPINIFLNNEYNMEIQLAIKGGHETLELITDTERDEPSTIFFKLPLAEPKDINLVEKLNYYPAYASMNPYQRYIYLKWLVDPTQKIDIGYVFVYYYGLERQLMTGNFDLAFNEILLLRRHHNNRSFINYSNIALTHACLVKEKYDHIEELLQSIDVSFIDNVIILIMYYAKKPLNSIHIYGLIDDIIRIKNKPKFNNYYKKNPELFFKNIDNIMLNKYPKGDWHFYNDFDLSKIETIEQSAFANYSFPKTLKMIQFPDFLTCSEFKNKIFDVISEAHEKQKWN